MKAIIQRVLSASVSVNRQKISSINHGVVILLGIEKNDSAADLNYMVKKSADLRIFNDVNNKMNLSIKELNGEALVISQFTLCANIKQGRRPSFINAASPKIAKTIFEKFCKQLQDSNISVHTGRFGAMMEVKLINDGPVTIILDSLNR